MREQLSTRSIPGPERVQFVHQALGRVLGADIGVRPSGPREMQAELRRVQCGPLQFLEIAGEGFVSERRGPGRPDWVSVMVQLEGAVRARHGRDEARLVAGDVCLMPPTGALVVERPQHFRHVLVDVPRAMLDEACPGWQARVLGRIEADRAGARCLGELLRLLLSHERALGTACREEFSHAALALVTQTLAGGTVPAAAGAATGRTAELHRQRVRQYVLENLRDPELSVPRIAAALQFSPRYLHKLFQDEQVSLMRWVQQQRLQACRHELAHRGTRTVSDVAYDWGFSHPSHFSRAYRRLFGVAPSLSGVDIG